MEIMEKLIVMIRYKEKEKIGRTKMKQKGTTVKDEDKTVKKKMTNLGEKERRKKINNKGTNLQFRGKHQHRKSKKKNLTKKRRSPNLNKKQKLQNQKIISVNGFVPTGSDLFSKSSVSSRQELSLLELSAGSGRMGRSS